MDDWLFIGRKVLCEAKKWVYDCFIVVVELSFRFNGIFLEKMVWC